MNRDPDNQLEIVKCVEVAAPCLSCPEIGVIKVSSMEIPWFGTTELFSFSCEFCMYTYKKVQSVNTVDPHDQAMRYTLRVENIEDLHRIVIQADGCILSVPEISLVVAKETGGYNTIEGCLWRLCSDLEASQLAISCSDPTEESVAAVLSNQISSLLEGLKIKGTPFHLIMEDDTGSSSIEKLHAEDLQVFVESIEPIEDVMCAGELESLDDLKLSVNQIVKAWYLDDFIDNCRITKIGETHIWVEEASHPENGQWITPLDGVIVQGSNLKLIETNDSYQTDMELLVQLNALADHVGILENRTIQKKSQGEVTNTILDGID